MDTKAKFGTIHAVAQVRAQIQLPWFLLNKLFITESYLYY